MTSHTQPLYQAESLYGAPVRLSPEEIEERSLAPGEETRDLIFETGGGFVRTTLPAVDFYRVIEIAAAVD